MITFNNKKETDIQGVFLKNRSISMPDKKIITVDVPYMNGAYDFSTVGSNGEIVYTQRIIQCNFGILANSKSELQSRFNELSSWLLDIGKSQLIFDDLIDVYFLAQVEKGPSLDEVLYYGETSVTFIADPFKIGRETIDVQSWDLFNFETDKFQDTAFDVVDSATVTVYNPGRAIVPTITADATMTVTLGSYTTTVNAGENKDYGFKLLSGDNTINIAGTGHIEFVFRKEAL